MHRWWEGAINGDFVFQGRQRTGARDGIDFGDLCSELAGHGDDDATWDFGLSDISSLTLTILGGTPVALAYTLTPKVPTTSVPPLVGALLPVSVNSEADTEVLFGRQPGGIFNAAITDSVPEPSTWALMLVGFGIAGAAMRRRPKVSVRYA